MSTKVTTEVTTCSVVPDVDSIRSVASYADRLVGWFGVSFATVDANTGEVLFGGDQQPCADWPLRGEFCRAMVHVRQPEIIAEEGPITVLALPPTEFGSAQFVATATFVARHDLTQGEVFPVTQLLGLDEHEALQWIRQQPIWSAEAAMAMGRMCLKQMAAEANVESLEHEVENLSDHLASTYEEISLLYRLTQNLKISSREDELGKVAL
ncbi:MAG: hypothetical protein MI757_12430, partial [Pirellulales bacterium]|nr:hypothetical protein [Pirellulales bacterium]